MSLAALSNMSRLLLDPATDGEIGGGIGVYTNSRIAAEREPWNAAHTNTRPGRRRVRHATRAPGAPGETMIFIRAFEPDEDYDQAHASDGVSRYGAYLAQPRLPVHRRRRRADHRPGTVRGRRLAVAQHPTMAPGYVRWHGRVQATSTHWDDESQPAVCVELAVSSAPEAACFTFPWRRWIRDELGHWLPPENFARPNALTVLRIAIPLSGVTLPRPRYVGGRPGCPDTATAKQAVQTICRVLNAPLAYVLAFDPLTGAIR